MRSGARQCPWPATCGMTLRHRYDDVGLPCRNTTGSPCPTSTYAISLSSTFTRRRSYGSAAEMAGTFTPTLYPTRERSLPQPLLRKRNEARTNGEDLDHIAAGEDEQADRELAVARRRLRLVSRGH